MGVIRQLKNFFTGKIIYPKTLTKAVYDENGERLDKILRDTMLAVDNEEYNGVEPRDADTLGGKYTAKNISAIEDKLTDLNSSLTKVKTYVGSDGKLHFVDAKGADSVLPFSGSNKYIDSNIQVTGGENNTTTNDYSVVVPSNVKTCTIFSNVFAWAPSGYPATIQIYKNGIQITPNFTYTYFPSYHYLIAIAVIDVLEGDTIRLVGSNTGASASGINAVAHCLVWS